MKIGVISLGCAKNLVDTENLLGILKESGQEIVTSYDDAEAVIINTCGFIESAKKEAIDTILEMADYKQRNLRKLIVMGCLAQRYQKDLEQEMPEVDRFISLNEYDRLGSILSEVLGVRIANDYGKAPRVLSGKPWMAYLRIADGCDNRCSYCAIPLIRGPFRSFSEEELAAEATRLVQGGVRELNLIAQDTSRYGVDWDGRLHLSSLLRKLDAIPDVHWIRILYLYPDEITQELIDTMKECRHVLPYFDIPTQHGSDRILKAMNRRGTRQTILQDVEWIRGSFAHPVLRTTLIAGFPGESRADHEQTLDLMRRIHWDHLGAFTYSREEGTSSYLLEDDVPEEEKQRRREEIMALQEEIVTRDHQQLIGTVQEVLVEGNDPLSGMYIGRSSMYAPDGVDGCVRFRSGKTLACGDFVPVRITKLSGQNLIGTQEETSLS